MKIFLCPKRNPAVTLLDILIVVVILGVMLAAISRPLFMEKKKNQQIRCLNNLKQIGMAFQVWAADHGDTYPMFVSQTNGGSMEFDTGPNAWRHFQVMSNELSTPAILFCPADPDRARVATHNFNPTLKVSCFLGNSNLSYFVGIVSNGVMPDMLLAGDRNITNGTPAKNGIVELTAARPGGWTADMHKKSGTLAFADGSVASTANNSLQKAAASATNHLQMPILAP